jgi:hypothetical protein
LLQGWVELNKYMEELAAASLEPNGKKKA